MKVHNLGDSRWLNVMFKLLSFWLCFITVDHSAYAGVFFKMTDLVAAGNHTCIMANGKATCWGHNSHLTPLAHASELIKIATGDERVCVMTAMHDVQCWVAGNREPLPDFFKQVEDFAVGSRDVCALNDEGVVCWSPRLETLPEIGSSARSIFANQDLMYVSDGASIKWENWNPSGGGGLPYFQEKHWSKDVIQLVGGFIRCSVLKKNSTHSVYCGRKRILELDAPLQLVSGTHHYCALNEHSGTVSCWGYEESDRDHYPFDDVVPHVIEVPSDLGKAFKIAAGANHTCAFTGDGVKCWGRNDRGQLNVPVDLPRSLDHLPQILRDISTHLYAEKAVFTRDTADILSLTADDSHALMFFALTPFFQSLNSAWSVKELHPDLPIAAKSFARRFGQSGLTDFSKNTATLVPTLRVISSAIKSARSSLTLASQREIDGVLMPALAEKLAETRLTERDAEEIASLFAIHHAALDEVASVERLAAFKPMISGILGWYQI